MNELIEKHSILIRMKLFRLSPSMFAAVEVTESAGAVLSDPALLADALLRLQVELSVCRTIRQTLSSIFVEVRTVGTFPTFLADARAVHAEPVAGAGRV